MAKKRKHKKRIVKKTKRQLSNVEIARRLKRARVVKSLHDLKNEKDKKFRDNALRESLIPTSSLNAEIRSRVTRKRRATKNQIRNQKKRIDELTKQNRRIKQMRDELELEYPYVEDERKREIERLLKSPDYQMRDTFTQKNLLKQMQNRDFDFVVDDGFEKYKINTREFKKQWRNGNDASIVILKRMQRNTKRAIKKYENEIKQKQKTATKQELKKLNRIVDALKNKLSFTIEKNIESLQTGDSKLLDDYNERGDKSYSILNRVIGFNIDRIGI